MYIPELYKNENQAEIRQFIHENGFAVLVSQTAGKLWGTHIPLILETDGNGSLFLHGHVSKLNPQGMDIKEGEEVLAIFQGPHAYISSSWYDHENVPTWNYLAVHAYGKIRVLNYEETVHSLKKLVDRYEAGSENPVRVEDLSEKTMREARGVTGFRIDITSIEAKKKLSQNRDAKNYQNIISELEKRGDSQSSAIAAEMKKCPND